MRKNEKGQSLFEIIVAISLIALIITSIVSITSIALKNNVHARNQSLAVDYTQEAYEHLRSIKNENWDAFYPYSSDDPGTTWCMNTLENPLTNSGDCDDVETIDNKGTQFTREATLVRNSINSISVNIEVSWSESGKSFTNKIYTYLNDY